MFSSKLQLNQVSMIPFLNMKHCLFLVLWFESNNEKALQMMKQITENMKKTKEEETAKEKVHSLSFFTFLTKALTHQWWLELWVYIYFVCSLINRNIRPCLWAKGSTLKRLIIDWISSHISLERRPRVHKIFIRFLSTVCMLLTKFNY